MKLLKSRLESHEKIIKKIFKKKTVKLKSNGFLSTFLKSSLKALESSFNDD